LNEQEKEELKETVRAMAPVLGMAPETMDMLFGGGEAVGKELENMKRQVRILTVFASRVNKAELMASREVVRNAEKAEGPTN
jgi:hypothetical protein